MLPWVQCFLQARAHGHADMAADGHKQLIKEHYDAHVDFNVSTSEALFQRKQGAALPLKRYHNEIKRQLIQRFAFAGCSLLDLCCGRGGDIHKWKDAGIGLVHGVDISPNEVAEAARRFQELQSDAERRQRKTGGKAPPMTLQAQFEVCDTLGDAEYQADDAPFDLVTCMFAMHYFFEAESKLRMFLRNVSNNLKPGGYFIGTIPDGKRVLWHLGGRRVFRSPFLQLEKKWASRDHELQPFGHAYLWALHDTVTAGAGGSEGSLEFLTFITPIIRIAAHYDLQVVLDYGDEQVERLFEEEDRYQQPFKHFFPDFPDSDPSLMVASSVFMAFVFRKLEKGAEVPPLVPPLPKTIPDLQQEGHHEQQEQQEPMEEGDEQGAGAEVQAEEEQAEPEEI